MKLNEAETRLQVIDPALKGAGWSTGGAVRVRAEFQITAGRILGAGKRAPAKKADYLLEYKGKYLAVVEAKPEDASYTEGVSQAKDYSSKLGVRFAFSTNGKRIYMIDMQTGVEKEVDEFPSPDELWEMNFAEQDEWRDRFGDVPLELKGGQWSVRYYQEVAVTAALEAIVKGKNRILLTLATGTGKTSIAFQIAWKLFQSRWTLSGDQGRRPRILFLADRNVLANQAFNEFSAFPEDALVRIDPAEIKRKGTVPKNGNLFFTIFQTFTAEANAEPNFWGYEPDFFDLIIVDECHRGGANDESTWRAILEYFSPAVQIGLTATPKRDDNVDTYEYFGEPVFVYSLREGIEDGFLTPFRVQVYDSTLDDYIWTPDDEVIEGEVEEGKLYTEKDFNVAIEIEERERHRVKLFLDAINKDEKTLVFCANQRHALLIRDLINQESDSTNPDYCHRVTADEGAIGDQHLAAFQDNEKTIPTILTTSHKLSTGVDARNIRNIVLLRPIKSMIEFKQIIGRGTRLYEGKDYFTIYDFVEAYHHFSDADWDGEPQEPVPKPPTAPGPDNPGEPGPEDPGGPEERPKKVRIKLADGKERTIQHTTKTLFYGPNGKPVSVEEFMQGLFETIHLPDFFGSEKQLREAWSKPSTRKALLARLDASGFGVDELTELQKIIDAEDCDLVDVLEYVGFRNNPVSRAVRAQVSRPELSQALQPAEMDFVDFVLGQYVQGGTQELDDEKLPTLVEIKYTDLLAGLEELGGADQARELFISFQEQLFREPSAYERVAG